LAKYGLSFDLQIYPSQMRTAAKLAAAHPDTAMILNHTGMPVDRDADGIRLWREGMRTLAAQPNVSTKISGFGIINHGWTTESIRPFVLEAIELFGADRAMFASDAPTDKLYARFDQIMDAYDVITADFTDNERAKLFADNAKRIYRLGSGFMPAIPPEPDLTQR
jgi:predicted TIM-barrel fold metal-dependent hydrolase